MRGVIWPPVYPCEARCRGYRVIVGPHPGGGLMGYVADGIRFGKGSPLHGYRP
jgi:hypothetical protein